MSKYSRNYINLNEESKRYGIDNKKVFGKCILEENNNQGKVIVSVENLKKGTYYVHLLVSQHGQYVAVELDKLNDKLELKKQISNGFIKDTKYLLKDTLAVMVGVMEDGKLIPVLVGYKKDKINYKGNFYVYKGRTNNVEKKPEDEVKVNPVKVKYKDDNKNKKDIKQMVREDVKEEQKQVQEQELKISQTKVEEEVKVVKIEEEKEPEVQKIKDEPREEKANINDFFGELFSENESCENAESVFGNILSRFKEEINEIKHISEISNNEFMRMNNSVLQIDLTRDDGNLTYMFTHNNEIKPFSRQNKNVEWITIDLKELTVVSKKCWELRRNPLVLRSYTTYGHFILGRYTEEDKKHYLLGIPDVYDERNLDAVKQMGVVQYKPCDNMQLQNSVSGYWIILNN